MNRWWKDFPFGKIIFVVLCGQEILSLFLKLQKKIQHVKCQSSNISSPRNFVVPRNKHKRVTSSLSFHYASCDVIIWLFGANIANFVNFAKKSCPLCAYYVQFVLLGLKKEYLHLGGKF